MKVLHQDARKGEIKLLIETLDDLWYLCNILEKDDIAYAKTYRLDEMKDDKIRPDKPKKITMTLGLQVEKVEFHEFSNRLRILGTIKEGPVDIGSYHTHNIDVGDDIKIVKEDWKDHQLQQIKEAIAETNRPIVTFLAIEDGEATIAELRQYGVRHIANITANFSGKQYPTPKSKEGHDEFYGEVLAKLKQAKGEGGPTSTQEKEMHQRHKQEKGEVFQNKQGKGESSSKSRQGKGETSSKSRQGKGETSSKHTQASGEGSQLVILGPGFAKEAFIEFAKTRDPQLMSNIIIDHTGHAGMVGIYESIKRGTAERLVQESRTAYEIQLIEQFLGEIAKNGLAVYGPNEIESALNMGAVETLFIVDIMIREKKADKLIELAKNTKTKITIISSVHEGGKKLVALGGMGGLLRYRIHG